MSDLKTIRGMPDLYGKDIEAISMIEKTCKEVFLAFNYSEIRTPLIEYKSLFERSVGESSEIIQQKEVFELDDRKGEMLCLRPEGTAGLVRSLITNGLDDEEIKKFFYIGPMFRYERPQKGRKRQFFQAGVELIGNAIYGDLEVIQVAKMILDKLITCFKLTSNYEGAISFLNKFLDKNPYSKYAWFELGKIYFSQKKYKESKTSHEFAIICDDSFSASHIELGKVHEKMENFEIFQNFTSNIAYTIC